MYQPVAQKNPVTLTTAGRERVDNYFWLKERGNPHVTSYLQAENAYTKAVMNNTEHFQEKLYIEITSRIKQEDQSTPYFKNGYFYYTRYEKGGEYPIYCRRKESMDAPEEVMLDGNKMSQGHAYFHIDDYEVSPDNKMLAYCVDTVGRRIYATMFKNLHTGEATGAIISDTAGSLAWADDNKTLFYTLKNPETLRSEKLMAHVLEGSQPDRLVFYERDEAYDLDVFRSKSDKMIFVASESNSSTEYRFVDAEHPNSKLRIVQKRRNGLEYQLEHYQDKFYIITNYHAKNFRLMETLVEKPSIDNWKELIAHREDVLLEDFEVFKDFLVVVERQNGLIQFRIRSTSGEEHYMNFDEEAYNADICCNPSFNSELLRFTYNSLTTPCSTFDYNMRLREKTLLKRQEIPGGFNSDEYIAKRLYAPSHDEKKIPVSLVYRKDLNINGQTPLLLYGYGSYGCTVDPTFSVSRISLLDRGFVFAIAHVRGGQTLGRQWYDDGKLLNKRNTFLDFIACAEYLIAQKYTDADNLCAMGGSAGGLLMGAVLNMRPDLFKAVIAAAPFVDVITTMSDKTIPLTTGEYDEWGNPEEETFYNYIMSYSPYDNVTRQNYPNILVTTGLHDSQVQYWEPAKWVAKLRELKTDDNLLLLHTNMDAGHSGASGRFEQYRETALEYAFLLLL